MPPPLHPSPFSGLRSFLRPLLSLSLPRSLAPSPSGPPPHPFCLLRHPHHSPYLSPGPPPPPSLSLLYLSIYLSLLRRTFSSSAPPLVAAVLAARHTVAVCPLSLQSHPLYSRLLLGAALSRESVLTGVLLFPRRPTRLRSLRALDSPRESRYLSARFLCARNNLHRTRSCEIEP